MPQVNARRFEKNKKSDDRVKDVDFFREFNKVRNTVFATNNWVKALERFRETKGYSEKIENVENVEELDKQLSEYIATMKQQNGTDYSVSSIRAAVAALYRYLNKNSIIKHINLYDSNIFTSFSETVNGKIKYLTDLGHGEANGSDGLTAEEIKIFYSNVVYIHFL
ncbi:hypothetical protein C1646_764583 [Rhizophagus diaphanus]|nr:hypothetical protein C1646_764583 [Rhizophagus diaphanus] [Rhizophagus sp. MUCL 43196]